MVRATNSGVTAVVSPTGEISRQLPVFTRDIIVADIALPSIKTFYTVYGDAFALLCLLSVVAVLAWQVIERRRSGKDQFNT